VIDAIVFGGSLPGLLVALDLAEVGLRVAVVDSHLQQHESLTFERDPESVIAHAYERIAGPLAATNDSVATQALPVQRSSVAPMLRGVRGEWVQQHAQQVLGIPAVPLATQQLQALGGLGALRAYLDRLIPLLTVGKTRTLGELVRHRLGRAVLQQLVEPQVFERYGVSATQVDVAIAAPGLNEALSRAGALSAAVLAYSDRNMLRETLTSPVGGTAELHDELRRKLVAYGVDFTIAEVKSVTPDDSEWVIELEDGEQLRARSLVVDQGASVVSDSVKPRGGGSVSVERARIYAEIDIDTVDWLPEGHDALAVAGGWAIRATHEAGRCHVRVASASDLTPEVLKLHDELAAADPTGAMLTDLVQSIGFSVVPKATWKMQVRAAPFVSVTQRDQAEATLNEAMCEAPASLIMVGRALHGDDLSSAITHAHHAAVELRRNLLGIA